VPRLLLFRKVLLKLRICEELLLVVVGLFQQSRIAQERRGGVFAKIEIPLGQQVEERPGTVTLEDGEGPLLIARLQEQVYQGTVEIRVSGGEALRGPGAPAQPAALRFYRPPPIPQVGEGRGAIPVFSESRPRE